MTINDVIELLIEEARILTDRYMGDQNALYYSYTANTLRGLAVKIRTLAPEPPKPGHLERIGQIADSLEVDPEADRAFDRMMTKHRGTRHPSINPKETLNDSTLPPDAEIMEYLAMIAWPKGTDAARLASLVRGLVTAKNEAWNMASDVSFAAAQSQVAELETELSKVRDLAAQRRDELARVREQYGKSLKTSSEHRKGLERALGHRTVRLDAAEARIAELEAAANVTAKKPAPEIRELLCQLCNREHPVWFAPNAVWNAVMRDIEGNDRQHFVCPTCFTVQAEVRGFKVRSWCLAPEEQHGAIYTAADLEQVRVGMEWHLERSQTRIAELETERGQWAADIAAGMGARQDALNECNEARAFAVRIESGLLAAGYTTVEEMEASLDIWADRARASAARVETLADAMRKIGWGVVSKASSWWSKDQKDGFKIAIERACIVEIDYTDDKGQRSIRQIAPRAGSFVIELDGASDQFTLVAYDIEQMAQQSYALARIHSWRELPSGS